MRITRAILARYTAVPDDARALRELLDDVGLEVKRSEPLQTLGQPDVAYDIEILANRGDHYCYAGMARELHGRTGAGLRLPERARLVEGDPGVPVRVETELCLRYTATALELDGPAGALPAEVLAPLEAAGIHSINAPVDATNLSNLELGQPTHIFDADTIVGGIVVRLSRPGESCLPLFAEARLELPEGTLVIADEEKVLAVAGVIGCEECKTTPASRRLLLESACFDPVSVRKTSRALDIRTDSSVRFERGSDPEAALAGAARVAWLLEQHAGARRVGGTSITGPWRGDDRVIALDPSATRAFLHVELSDDEMAERLARYGFSVETTGDRLSVTVPPVRRWDVEFAADLVEELARSLGYNDTPIALPPVDMGSVPGPAEQVRARVDAFLVDQGFYEVITDGFYGHEIRARLGVGEDHPLHAHVGVLNSLDKGYSLLKNNAFVQLVDGIGANLRMRESQVKAFEWTRTFHPDAAAENGLCTERAVLAVVACGLARPASWGERPPPADAVYLKGLVEELALMLGLPLQVGAADPGQPLADCLHPGRQASVRLEGRVVGVLGEAHPDVLKRCGIKRARPVYLELEAEALFSPAARPAFVEPPDQPPTTRNLAFTLPHKVEAGAVLQAMRGAAPDWLVGLDVTDLYPHEEDGAPVRTLTFELAWSNAARTRTADEINGATEAMVAAVTAALGERGVKLR